MGVSSVCDEQLSTPLIAVRSHTVITEPYITEYRMAFILQAW